MKVMIDTNIFLDLLLDRKPFADDSARVLELCENRRIDGYISASCVTDIFYITRKYSRSSETAYKAVGKVLEIAKVGSVTNSDVLTAYERHAPDFEDCLLAVCAKSMKCSCIVTRNKQDFEGMEIEALTPKELLEKFK